MSFKEEYDGGPLDFFYFHTLKENKGRVYLVTNKHVLDGNSVVYVRVNPKALGTAKGYSLNLTDPQSGEKLWKGHYDSKVDVAVIPVNFNPFQEENMQVSYFKDDKHTLDTKSMEEKEQSAGDSVFVLGFPVSLV